MFLATLPSVPEAKPLWNRVPYREWREDWPFKVNVDESYPLVVRMAGEELLVGFSNGGDDDELQELTVEFLRELEDTDVEVESFSGYEVGRGASGDVLVFLITTPFAWSLTTMADLAIRDPKKLAENLRYWGSAWQKLLEKFRRLGVSQLSKALIRQAALAQFAQDFPDRTPDVERVRLLSEVGDIPEAGWAQSDETIVIIPAVKAHGTVIYVMDELGSVKDQLSTLSTNPDSLGFHDIAADPLLIAADLKPGDDPSLEEVGDEYAHVPSLELEDERLAEEEALSDTPNDREENRKEQR